MLRGMYLLRHNNIIAADMIIGRAVRQSVCVGDFAYDCSTCVRLFQCAFRHQRAGTNLDMYVLQLLKKPNFEICNSMKLKLLAKILQNSYTKLMLKVQRTKNDNIYVCLSTFAIYFSSALWFRTGYLLVANFWSCY